MDDDVWEWVVATTDSHAVEVCSMTARIAAGRVARVRRQLGERDLAVLQSLYRLRLLSGHQVQRLHVSEGSVATQARRARAQLKRLADLRLVVRLGRQIGGVYAGSKGFVFGLSGLGLAVLDVAGPFGRRRRTVWATKPYFQDHMLAVSELYVRLVETCRTGTTELLDFEAEPACWRRFTGVGGETIVLKPDALVRVGIGDFEQRTFVEVDLGSESLPTIHRKCQVFINYWRSGLEQQRHEVFPRVAWLVPDPRRLAGISEALRRLTHDAGELFTVALADDGPTLLTTLPTHSGDRS